jgi:hypothetical protein
MNVFLKKASLAFVCMLVLLPLYANDTFVVERGDIGSIRLYDGKGIRQPLDTDIASRIEEGWIVVTADTPLLVETPFGMADISENSIVVLRDISATAPSFYLVDGKAAFSTDESFSGTLSVLTPVSSFVLQEKGQLFVVSTETEESVVSFGGSVIATNDISGAVTSVMPFGKLLLDDPLCSVVPVDDRFYLSHAIHPDLGQSTDTPQDLPSVPLPAAPTVSAVVPEIPDSPRIVRVSAEPQIPAPPTIVEETAAPEIAGEPQFIDVQTVPVPPDPTKINTSLAPAPPSRIVATVTAEADATVPQAAVQEAEEEPGTDFTVPKTAILSTSEDDVYRGSIGVETTYTYTYDGTAGNSQTHTLTILPYVTYDAFTFQARVSGYTSDFVTFDSFVFDLPTDTLGTISYASRFIERLQIGYDYSPFFLAIDDNDYRSSELLQLVAPSFGETDELGFYAKANVAGISLATSFDDLHLDNYMDDESQYGSLTLLIEGSGNYPFQMMLEGLLEIGYDSGRTYDLFPSLSFRFPLLDSRNLQMGLLVGSQGYLPLYPDYDTSQLFDLNTATLFPNYLLNAGLVIHAGAVDGLLQVNFEQGEVSVLMVNDFDLSASDADFSILGSLSYATDRFDIGFLWNMPFTDDFSIAVTDSGRKADLSQFSVSSDLGPVSLSFGLEQIGIIDAISSIADGSEDLVSLFGGEYASSYLQATYETGPATFEAKALFPVSSTSYTVPQITVSATIDLGMQLR